jgi:(E)-4-hydroxy-3-methylbut-2-enyl-diphosphate synthase
MTNTDTRKVAATVKQIRSLVATGCEIVRVTVPDAAAAAAFGKIRAAVPHVPLVADIHFDHRLALAAVAAGADKIRINPGNLGGAAKLAEVVAACKARRIPIRVGVNSGSLEVGLTARRMAGQLAQSAVRNVRLIEKLGYRNIVVSAKGSSVPVMYAAYQELAKVLPEYPLHLGVTEAGGRTGGTLKSAAGIGGLLLAGIGDTIRISLTDKPEVEVTTAHQLLRALELRQTGVNVVSCPTCGRTEVNLIPLVKKVEKLVADIKKPLTVAVMGCVVNGPGEAAHADYALVGGRSQWALYAKGKFVKAITEGEALPELRRLLDKH